MKLRQTFAENLARTRREKKLSQEALAHEAGVDRSYVSLLERAKFSATLDMVEDLAKALGVDTSVLLTRPTKKR